MRAGRLLAREQVQLGVGTVRDPFLAGAYIRRTSLLCDSPSWGLVYVQLRIQSRENTFPVELVRG